MIDKQALFSPEKGGRDDAPDFVVLFTDGDPTNLPESKVNTSVFLIVLLVTSFVYILRKRFLTCRIIWSVLHPIFTVLSTECIFENVYFDTQKWILFILNPKYLRKIYDEKRH